MVLFKENKGISHITMKMKALLPLCLVAWWGIVQVIAQHVSGAATMRGIGPHIGPLGEETEDCWRTAILGETEKAERRLEDKIRPILG